MSLMGGVVCPALDKATEQAQTPSSLPSRGLFDLFVLPPFDLCVLPSLLHPSSSVSVYNI